jgi:hypothetical protein
MIFKSGKTRKCGRRLVCSTKIIKYVAIIAVEKNCIEKNNDIKIIIVGIPFANSKDSSFKLTIMIIIEMLKKSDKIPKD